MPLPSSGPLTLTDIQTEFGGTNPIGLDEYYAGGGLVPSGTSGTNGAVPSSGAISIFNFYGTTAAQPFGADAYTTPGTYSFIVPAGISEICAVCVGAGGGGSGDVDAGGGGALSYSNGISVTAGETLTVIVGAGILDDTGQDSAIQRSGTNLVLAKGGGGGRLANGAGGAAASGVGAVRNSGGSSSGNVVSGAGGAAGYSGTGGNGVLSAGGNAGLGGGGGGGGATASSNSENGAGGGVGLIVEGASGTGGAYANSGGGFPGAGGSGGNAGTRYDISGTDAIGGTFGGGSGSDNDASSDTIGANGGVRIIYGGTGKTYPNNSAP